MIRLSHALNAGAIAAGLVALAAIIGAFGSLFAEAGPDEIESAMLARWDAELAMVAQLIDQQQSFGERSEQDQNPSPERRSSP